MSEDLHIQARELLRDVKRKDQKFRIWQVVFNLLIIGLLIIALSYGYHSFQQNQNQRSAKVQAIIKEVDRNRDFMACIVKGFDSPDYQRGAVVNQCINASQ